MHPLLLLLSLAGLAETDPDEIPEEAPDLSMPVPDPSPLERPELAIGLGLGVAVPSADLAAGPLIRLEGSATLPAAQGRFRPFVSAAWTSPRQRGTAVDERLPSEDGTATWTLVLSQLQLAAGVGLRALPHSAPISVELCLAPMAVVVHSELRASTGGVDLGGDSGWQLRPGFLAGVDLVADLGPGQLRLGLTTTGAKVHTLAAGPIDTLTVTPALGYQLPFSPREDR